MRVPRLPAASRSIAGAVATAWLFLGCLVQLGCDRRIDVDFNHAFENGDHERALELLERGADIDARFLVADGFTTLMMAARTGWKADGFLWLLEQGADPDVRSYSGRTALHVAAAQGRTRHVEILIAAGADVRLRTDRGEAALDIARGRGYEVVARLLEEAGGAEKDPL